MHLTQFTDLGIRVLMYLTQTDSLKPTTSQEITDAFNISRHNLNKVVYFMGQNGWITTIQGKNGGIILAKNPQEYFLGDIIRQLESSFKLVECSNPLCPLEQGCELKKILNDALNAFFAVLDQYTLSDLVKNQTKISLQLLHRINITALTK